MTTPNTEQRNDAVREAADAYDAFVKAREAMNAARPALDASPAERALYDERYRADHEAEREHWRTAIKLAQSARSILAALSQPPAPSPLEGEVREKVARAICKARGETPDQCLHGYSWAAGEMGRAEGGEVCHRRAWQYHIAAADAAIAALSTEAGSGEVQYRHVKRGTVYTVVAEGILQCAANPALDEQPVVIYRGEDGKHWVRGYTEFHDGRFAAIAEAGKPAPSEPVAEKRGMSACNRCGKQYPSAPLGYHHKCGECPGTCHPVAPVEPAPSEERLREALVEIVARCPAGTAAVAIARAALSGSAVEDKGGE